MGSHVPVLEGHVGAVMVAVAVIRPLAGTSGWILYGEYVSEERAGEIRVLSHLMAERGSDRREYEVEKSSHRRAYECLIIHRPIADTVVCLR